MCHCHTNTVPRMWEAWTSVVTELRTKSWHSEHSGTVQRRNNRLVHIALSKPV